MLIWVQTLPSPYAHKTRSQIYSFAKCFAPMDLTCEAKTKLQHNDSQIIFRKYCQNITYIINVVIFNDYFFYYQVFVIYSIFYPYCYCPQLSCDVHYLSTQALHFLLLRSMSTSQNCHMHMHMNAQLYKSQLNVQKMFSSLVFRHKEDSGKNSPLPCSIRETSVLQYIRGSYSTDNRLSVMLDNDIPI